MDAGPPADASTDGTRCAICDPVADCDPSGDEVACTCPETHEGDGITCVSKCENAGCDEHATCAVVDGDVECSCAAPYLGDGLSCEFDSDCALLDCHAEATCESDGSARSCECRPGFKGSGSECVNEDDCAEDPCGPGTCEDLVLDFQCQCPDGYSGKRCQNDACEDDPCANDLVCVRVPEGRVCQPSCAPDCGAGDRCIRDADCTGSMFCHADGVCLKPTCSGGMISEVAQLEALRFCDVITGGILLDNQAGADEAEASGSGVVTSFLVPVSTPLDLPYTRVISGLVKTAFQPLGEIDLPSLEEAGGFVLNPFADNENPFSVVLRAPKVQTVSNSVQVNFANPGVVDLRSLESIGGDLRLGLATLSSVRLDSLKSVGGDFSIGLLTLGSIDVDEVNSVGGEVNLSFVSGVSWDELSHLGGLGTSQTVQAIGCDLCPASEGYMCDGLAPPSCP